MTSTTIDSSCDQVVADSQRLSDLAARAANAAQHQDATSLTELVRELSDAENTLDDATSCHR
ncbi:MAG: hypothetical protein ABJA74_01895 [Lapillicoccus sp.]